MRLAVPTRTSHLPQESRERLLRLFEDRIYDGKFKDLSGWDRAALGVPFPNTHLSISTRDLRRYFFDGELPNDYLEEAKRRIANLASSRESMLVEPDNLLLTPGATAALTVVLHFLQASGTQIILTDAPFYFSIKKLCDALGMELKVAERSLDNLDEHSCIFELIGRHHKQRKAVLLTHPRYVISRNYPYEVLRQARSMLGQNDTFIIDQSVDMQFQNEDNFIDLEGEFVKIRTIGKALSLNGSRLAMILAREDLISKLNTQAGIVYGSLDLAMLKLGAAIAESPDRFALQLMTMDKLVKERSLEAKLTLAGSHFNPVKPENGFLGYIEVDTSRIGRFSLYQELLKESVHAMFSVHFGLRQLYHRELIRINYLLDFRQALMVLRQIGARSALDLSALS